MKKIFKNPIITFIIGVLLSGSVAGVVSYSMNAKDISYTPKDTTWEVDDVESAIKRNSTLNFESKENVVWQGDRTLNQEISKKLSKGKYLILVTDSQATIPSEKNRRQNSESSRMINCDSNCIITKVINPINISVTPSTSIPDSSEYAATNLHYGLYYVSVTSDTSTISY